MYCLILSPKWANLTNYMEQSPSWEADNHSSSQETPHLFWNPKVHYHVDKSLPLVLILSKMNLVHTLPSSVSMIHSNIIFPSMLRFSKWSLHCRFSNQNIVCIPHLSHMCYISHSSHLPWFVHQNNIWWSVQVMKLLSMQCSPAYCNFILIRSKYSPQHLVLKHSQFMFFP